MASRVLVLFLGLATSLLPAAAAQAQPQVSLQWYQHYERGLDHVAAGEWKAALTDFEDATRTRREPAARVRTYGARFLYDYDPLYHQARCLAELGRLDESRSLLAEAEAAGVTDEATIDALRRRLDALASRRERETEAAARGARTAEPQSPAPADAILEVRSSPAGARVRVDGRTVGTTPVDRVEVSPGRHRVELQLAGRAPWAEEVETPPGERLQLDVTLGEAGGGDRRPQEGARAAAPDRSLPPEQTAEARAPARASESATPAAPAPATPTQPAPLPAPPPAPSPAAAPNEGGAEEPDRFGRPETESSQALREPPASALPSGPPGRTGSPAEPEAELARAPFAGSTLLLAGAGLLAVLLLALVGAAVLRRRRAAPVRARVLPGRIGRYKVTGELGRGGMATTYRAVRARDGLAVAIKIPHETGDPTYLPRFLREGRLGETLHHPRIVRIVEAGEEAGRPFLAMELIPGRTLRQALDEAGGAIPVRRALEIARDVAEAVDYAHGKGVVHRDLKPENVMLLPDGTVTVMDFGVARVEGQPGLTTSSFFFGSPVYAAPELVDPPSIDHRADLYSLGVVLFELLEGRPPFHHESVFRLIEMHQKEPLPDPASLDRPLPDEVWRVLTRLLAKDPADRYAGAQELLVDLERLLYELPGDASGGDDERRSQRRHLRHSSLGS